MEVEIQRWSRINEAGKVWLGIKRVFYVDCLDKALITMQIIIVIMILISMPRMIISVTLKK